ncbi:Uncharacterised protein [Corynebacterium kutscheri]|uniref:Uncharacterized protein n=1 Tax=Corynebacterium kutscheri TaxID=35755 RepID=A0A0F6TDB0_9CORY|nr:hypothetical protein [Corynebacterium kutscheri]AKE40724.1 hypothetical protein UL82_02495 [Corynebacterium kutscheri]VEH04630.1 Uncharacterised protein [Corynebacterium kutscheri]VEH11121.1 Uncharacterised protein [Corynebacterium kutscheri]VEH80402.1 Uncharacterised protein [Corynebacterium kutscheri]
MSQIVEITVSDLCDSGISAEAIMCGVCRISRLLDVDAIYILAAAQDLPTLAAAAYERSDLPAEFRFCEDICTLGAWRIDLNTVLRYTHCGN